MTKLIIYVHKKRKEVRLRNTYKSYHVLRGHDIQRDGRTDGQSNLSRLLRGQKAKKNLFCLRKSIFFPPILIPQPPDAQ